MSTKNYNKVQFLGHVLSTTPKLKVSVEEMSDWGLYLGDDNDETDISLRVTLVKDVINQIISNNEIDNSPETLKIVTFPEFFFRGIKGAYKYDKKKFDQMYDLIVKSLENILNSINAIKPLDSWLFLFGSTLTTNDKTTCENEIDPILSRVGNDFLDVYKLLTSELPSNSIKSISEFLKIIDNKMTAETSNDEKLAKLLLDLLQMSDFAATKEIYNRCFIYYDGTTYSVQKENKSKEDFILNNPSELNGTVNDYLQTMVNYPSIYSLDNPIDTIPYSVFRCGNLNIGVEICLDHSRKRLATYLSNGKISKLDIQLVISCGMQLKQDSAATVINGYLFNCDGEYVIEGDAENGNKCHSQLKQLITGPNDTQILSPYIKASLRQHVKSTVSNDDPQLYPCGFGEIHIYAARDIYKE